jgi:hypothetical protein
MTPAAQPGLSPAPGLAVGVDEERVDGVAVRAVRERCLLERGFEPALDLVDLREHLLERALATSTAITRERSGSGIGSVTRPASSSSAPW